MDIKDIKKVPSSSTDITEQNIEKLKELFPEIVTDGKVDFDMLKEILGGGIDDSQERYYFTWPGKSKSIKGSQQPSKATLRPNLEKSKNFDTTENLYIEGDNLEVLKLLQKSYNGKIKCIYIDPPYNKGKDFVYKDNFKDTTQNYLEQTGQVDSDGNVLSTNFESAGRFHTNWLNMMYPRLRLARNLLSNEGVIFISIDDNEQANLKKICDEIFGEQNFVANLPTIMNLKGNNDEFGFAGTHEYTLVYGKNKEQLELGEFSLDDDELKGWEHDDYGYYKKGANLKATGVNAPREKRPNLFFPLFVDKLDNVYVTDNDLPPEVDGIETLYPITNGAEMSWRWSKSRFKKHKNDIIVVRGNDISIYKKQRPSIGSKPTKKPKSVFYKPSYSSGNGTAQIKELLGDRLFSNPKPIDLIKDFIEISTRIDTEDIVLDFFSGSSTAAHATVEQNKRDNGNRKFIMVQLPEQVDEKSSTYKAGYETIADLGSERIRRAGDKIIEENPELADTLDIGFKYLELDKSNIKEWNTDFDTFEEEIDLFEQVFVEGRSELDIVYEIMLKLGMELTYPLTTFEVDGKAIYDIAFGGLYICLADGIDINVAQAIIEKRDEYGTDTITSVVLKDSGFLDRGRDSDKLNVIQQLIDAGISQETIQTI